MGRSPGAPRVHGQHCREVSCFLCGGVLRAVCEARADGGGSLARPRHLQLRIASHILPPVNDVQEVRFRGWNEIVPAPDDASSIQNFRFARESIEPLALPGRHYADGEFQSTLPNNAPVARTIDLIRAGSPVYVVSEVGNMIGMDGWDATYGSPGGDRSGGGHGIAAQAVTDRTLRQVTDWIARDSVQPDTSFLYQVRSRRVSLVSARGMLCPELTQPCVGRRRRSSSQASPTRCGPTPCDRSRPSPTRPTTASLIRSHPRSASVDPDCAVRCAANGAMRERSAELKVARRADVLGQHPRHGHRPTRAAPPRGLQPSPSTSRRPTRLPSSPTHV